VQINQLIIQLGVAQTCQAIHWLPWECKFALSEDGHFRELGIVSWKYNLGASEYSGRAVWNKQVRQTVGSKTREEKKHFLPRGWANS